MRPNPPYSGMCLFTNRHRRLYMATKKSFPFGPEDMASGAVPFSDAVKESAQQIWLAGLGAFSKAQAEGGFGDFFLCHRLGLALHVHAFLDQRSHRDGLACCRPVGQAGNHF